MSGDAGVPDGPVRSPVPDRPPVRHEPHVGTAAATACYRFGFTAYAVRLLQDVYFLEWTVDAGTQLLETCRRSVDRKQESRKRPVRPDRRPAGGVQRRLAGRPVGDQRGQYGAGWLFEIAGDGGELLSPEEYVQHLAAVWEVTQRTIKGQLNA